MWDRVADRKESHCLFREEPGDLVQARLGECDRARGVPTIVMDFDRPISGGTAGGNTGNSYRRNVKRPYHRQLKDA